MIGGSTTDGSVPVCVTELQTSASSSSQHSSASVTPQMIVRSWTSPSVPSSILIVASDVTLKGGYVITSSEGKGSYNVPGCRRQIQRAQLNTVDHDHHVLTVKEDLELVEVAV